MNLILKLQQLGLSEKESKVYLALLQLGCSSVRKISKQSDVNRGTTYDILKSLITQGLVTYQNKGKSQFFIAESPDKFNEFVENKEKKLLTIKSKITETVPLLKAITNNFDNKPVTKLYKGYQGVSVILHDVLENVNKKFGNEYYVFSSAATAMNKLMYHDFKDFTLERIRRKIFVKAIAIGDRGEKKSSLSERKFLVKNPKKSSPTYILVYANKTAYISLDNKNQLVGVLIEDPSIYSTNKIVFNGLWELL